MDYRINQLLQIVKQEIKKLRQKYLQAQNQSQLIAIRAAKEIGLSGGTMSANDNFPSFYEDAPRYIEKIEGLPGEGRLQISSVMCMRSAAATIFCWRPTSFDTNNPPNTTHHWSSCPLPATGTFSRAAVAHHRCQSLLPTW